MRSKECEFEENAQKFQKIGYSSIIPFVYEGKGEINKYMQYEVSKAVCTDRITNQRKIPKWLPFENYRPESLNIWCAHMGDICACVYQI